MTRPKRHSQFSLAAVNRALVVSFWDVKGIYEISLGGVKVTQKLCHSCEVLQPAVPANWWPGRACWAQRDRANLGP